MRRIISSALACPHLLFILAASTSLADDRDKIDIVTRQQWGAKSPIYEMKANTPTQITIHHTAVMSNSKISLPSKLKSLQDFSQRSGKLASGKTTPAWADMPYHYYIDASGRIGEGLPVSYVGDTNTEYDPSGHISIVLEGNFDKEKVKSEQIRSLEKLTTFLAKSYKIDLKHINTHRDLAHTACPGKNFEIVYGSFRNRVEMTLRD